MKFFMGVVVLQSYHDGVHICRYTGWWTSEEKARKQFIDAAMQQKPGWAMSAIWVDDITHRIKAPLVLSDAED